MITVPWEKRIICIGVEPDKKDRLLADMHTHVQDKPYSESNYRRFIAAQHNYGHYSCCLDFDTITAERDGLVGEWISTGGLMDNPMFKPSFSAYAIGGRNKVTFFERQPNIYCMVLNMAGQLLYTSDDMNNDPHPDVTQIFEIIKERLLGTADYIELDDLCL